MADMLCKYIVTIYWSGAKGKVLVEKMQKRSTEII